MNEIFGVPMTSIMIFLLILLALFVLLLIWIALRRTMMFKIGLRNIPRRPAQTILIVIGLMLSTLIIAASLGTGDTIDYSLTSQAYNQLGATDELVVYSGTGDGEGSIGSSFSEHIPQTSVDDVKSAISGSGLVDGVGPILVQPAVPVALLDPALAGAELTSMTLAQPGAMLQAEPQVNVIGVDPAMLPDFGYLLTADGDVIDVDAMADDQVVISEMLAEDLGASEGDLLGFTYDNQPYLVTVFAVAENTALSGQFEQNVPGLMMPLDRLQEITGREGEITAVAVSNVGGVRDGIDKTDEVVDLLRSSLAGQALGVDPIKQDSVELAQLFANAFSVFFLIFGLFSIGVGILLIILIFTMLAAERRPEMGMARAVGAQRAQLVQQFTAEGSIYAFLAGLVGVALGVGAAYLIGYSFASLFGDFFDVTPHVTTRSMIVAYSLGVVITLLAVLISSMRISRLNIVAAVRDIPDIVSPTRSKRTLVWAVVLLAMSGLLAFAGLSSDSAFPFYFGMSLLPFGMTQAARFLGAPGKAMYTITGIYLLVLWLLPPDVEARLFGELNGDIEMFFLSGIFLVAGATLVIVQNLDLLMRFLAWVGSLFSASAPAVKTAIAFPSAVPGRTGMTVAMFSLITFSLVVFAAFNENFTAIFLGDEATAGWDVRADQGGANPIGSTEEFLAELEAQGADTNQIKEIGIGTTYFQGYLRQPGNEYQTYFVHGIDDGLITGSELTFQQRAEGYETDEAVIDALLNEPGVGVLDQAVLVNDGFGGDPNAFSLSDPDGDGPQEKLESEDKVFPPFQLELQGADGSDVPVKIIGIIDSRIGSFIGLYAAEDLILPSLPAPPLTSFFLKLDDPESAEAFAKSVEGALLLNGVQATSIVDELEEQQSQSQAFLYIMQGFMGLGLIVGLAAVGVIAFRNVVERRQQIGMMRAIGFQSSTVARSFLIEQGFVVAIGGISGAILGILLARKLFSSDDFAPEGFDFIVPWQITIVIIAVTIFAALLMTLVPARQAANLAPAEALRYE